jgi:hypothetical protein
MRDVWQRMADTLHDAYGVGIKDSAIEHAPLERSA